MNIKNKAVIMRSDRKNEVVTLRKKQLEGKLFKHGIHQYEIDSDRFMLTFQRNRVGLRRPFVTFYYIEGMPRPLPVPLFNGVEETVRDEKGNVQYDDDGKPVMVRVFPEMVNLGMSAEEAAVLWDPWFLRILASKGAKLRQDIQFWLIVGIACAVVYTAWNVHNLPETVADAVAARVAQAQAALPPPITR